MSSELLAAARDYLQRGLSVIALNGKAPNGRVHPRGLHDALFKDDPAFLNMDEMLKAVFNHPQTTGIGIRTNPPYFVVDIDGEEGAEAWLKIAGVDEYMPDRWVALTGRGLHLWYADTTPRRTRKLAPLLDLKASGGYVAAPPSLHPDGHTYKWLRAPGDLPPMEAPGNLVKFLDDQDWNADRKRVAHVANKRVRHAPLEGGKFWASWGFDGLLKAMREAEAGQRNSLLYWCAFTMVEDDATGEDFEQLNEAALTAGLTARETRLTIRSARKAASDE